MQTKRNDLRAISGEPTSNIVALPNSGSNVVVLDEASLEDVSGGAVPALIAACLASNAFRATALAAAGGIAVGFGYFVNRV